MNIKSFKWQDWLIIGAIVSNMLAYTFTVYITTSVSALGSSASYLEANPIARIIDSLGSIAFVFHILMYAALIIFYFYIKRKYSGDQRYMLMTGIAVIIFLLWTFDMLNDLGYVLRVFL
jgi:hypothetical protein